jgi:hypothetical protein
LLSGSLSSSLSGLLSSSLSGLLSSAKAPDLNQVRRRAVVLPVTAG